MIIQKDYDEIKAKYWNVASWTMWSQPTDRPKSNMGSLEVFNDPDLLNKINTGFVFVGLNGSGVHEGYYDPTMPWNNFHSDHPRGHDYKLRYALNGTPFLGSYITDIIKYCPEVDSTKLIKYVRNHPEIIQKNIDIFKDELKLLGGKPIIIALGNSSYSLLTHNLHESYQICKIKHYSYMIGKEKYREETLQILSKYI